jgi:CBS domain-containing membrane protein
MKSVGLWFHGFVPVASAVSARERWRAALGAAIGIFFTGALSGLILGRPFGSGWLIAPMGASAVLLFCTPSTPLAQPWSIVGGNLIAAVCGVAAARWIPNPVIASTVAITGAIGAMFAARCLHPPSGAVALTAVLGGADVHAAGFGFALVPVALDSLLMLVVALAYNNATGRRYPVGRAPARSTEVDGRIGFTVADVEAALKKSDQLRDIGIDDLVALFRQSEMHTYRRRLSDARCRDVMTRDVASVSFGTDLGDAWKLMHDRDVRALPVTDQWGHVQGIVTRADFIENAGIEHHDRLADRLHKLLARTSTAHSDKPEVVGQIMSTPARTGGEDTPIVELVARMSTAHVSHVPIVDARGRLTGIVSRSDMIGALYETALARLTEPQSATGQPRITPSSA